MKLLPILAMLGSRLISGAHKGGAPTQSPMEKVERLKVAGAAMVTELQLLNRLFAVEWAEQKGRWVRMAMLAALSFVLMICMLVFVGVGIVVLAWDTPYRNPAMLVVLVLYALAIILAWRRLQSLSKDSKRAFAATREELAADIALVKSKLWP